MRIFGGHTLHDSESTTLPAPVLPGKDHSQQALEAEVRMLTSQRDAERQRAVEARRLAARERAEVLRVREECDRKIAQVIQSATIALDEAKRKIALIGKGA